MKVDVHDYASLPRPPWERGSRVKSIESYASLLLEPPGCRGLCVLYQLDLAFPLSRSR